ncbi:ketopantoate reductase family protein [Bacteroidota bacterium]
MKIGVVGIGGVGGIFGGLLAHAGYDVTFLSRGKTLKKLKSDGIKIKSYMGNLELKKISAVDVSSSTQEIDLIILAVKAWQVEDTARLIEPMLHDDTVVIPLQNGVDAPDILRNKLGDKHVLPGMCRVVAFKSEPNIIEHTDVDPFIAFGERDNQKSERVEKIAEIFRNANIIAKIPDDIYSALWQKFLFVTSTSGIGAVTRIPMGLLRKVHETRKLFVRSINEIINIAEKKNIDLPGDIVAKSLDYLDNLKADSTSSTQRDIMEGRPSELEALNGAVVRMGKDLSIETPVNEFIYSSLLPMELIARNNLNPIKNNYS